MTTRRSLFGMLLAALGLRRLSGGAGNEVDLPAILAGAADNILRRVYERPRCICGNLLLVAEPSMSICYGEPRFAPLHRSDCPAVPYLAAEMGVDPRVLIGWVAYTPGRVHVQPHLACYSFQNKHSDCPYVPF